MTRDDKRKSRARVMWWLGGLIVAVPALLVALVMLSPHFMGGSADVEELADRASLSSEWALEYELVTPRMLGCWGGNACPSVNQRWERKTPLSEEEFLGLVEAVGGDPRGIESANLCGTDVQGCSTDYRVQHEGKEFWVQLRTGAPNDVAWDTDDANYEGLFDLGLIVQLA